MQIINKLKHFFGGLSLRKKISLLVLIIGVGTLIYFLAFKSKTEEVTYQTSVATVGTLITSISGSGTITSVNSTNISSKVSGVVSKVYVSNGDTVTKGQEIAAVTLDDYASARQTSAWNSYLNAQEAVKTAEKNKATADIEMWQARQDILDAEDEIEYKNTNSINPDTKEEYTLSERTIIDKTLEQSRLAFTEAETKYKNANSEIQAAKTQVSSALKDYQQNSATIIAPAAGVVSNLNLAEGMVIASTSNSNNNTASENSVAATATQTFGKISDKTGSMLATIALSEIDVINVKANQKATLIFDAYEDQSFTGKVLAVDTDGSVSSGVTTYSVTLVLDPVEVEIYSNMAVTADIITDLQTDVLLVPTTAIQITGEQATVQVLKDEEINTVNVEIGKANDSQTVITSGLNEGDEVVTGTLSTKSSESSAATTTSPFSGTNITTSRSSTGGVGVMTGGQGGPPGGF